MRNSLLNITFYFFALLVVCAQQTTNYLNHGFSYKIPYNNIATQANHIYPIDLNNSDTCYIHGAYIYNLNNYSIFFEKFDLINKVFVNDSINFIIDTVGYKVKLPIRKTDVKIGKYNYFYSAVDSGGKRKSLIFKKDLQSDEKYKWVGSVLNSNYVTNVLLLKKSNNQIIAVGQDYNFIGSSPTFEGRIYLSELDTNGVIHSTKYSYASLGANVGILDAIVVDYGIIVTGYRITHQHLPPPINNWVLPGFAMLFRNNGTQKVLKVGREDVHMDLPLGKIVKKNDSELLIRTFRSEPDFEPYAIKDAIICIDTALNVKWIQNLDSTEQYDKSIGDFIKTQDGNYVISGSENNTELNEEASETYQHHFKTNFLQKIDSTGKTIWKRNIVYNELYAIQTFNEIEELANGDLLTIGMLFDQFGIDDPPLQKMWLVRTDKYGCLVPGCDKWDDLDEKEANQIRLSLYPNPVVNELYVFNPTHAHSYKGELISLNGQVVKSNIFLSPQSTTIIPLSGLKSGIYILKCSDEKGNVQTHKIIKN